MGHIVNEFGIFPNQEKIQAIQALNEPTSVTGVKSFLGVVNLYRRFIPNCAVVSEPLIALTRKKGQSYNWDWGEEQQVSF